MMMWILLAIGGLFIGAGICVLVPDIFWWIFPRRHYCRACGRAIREAMNIKEEEDLIKQLTSRKLV